MSLIVPLERQDAPAASQPLLEMIQKRLGRIPNMYRVMAQSPAVLDAYVQLHTALGAGVLDKQTAELIALATAETNGCEYCVAAHTFLGDKTGLMPTQLAQGGRFQAIDPKTQAGLTFVQKALVTPRDLSPGDGDALRQAGYTDGEVLEMIAHVVRNVFTNYVNLVAGTPVDWPAPTRSAESGK